MTEACRASNFELACSEEETTKMLYGCDEAFVNTIHAIKLCGYGEDVCKDGGSGKSDYCA